ncbi:MAG: heavy metal transport/detoxification protein [Clostridiales bacterium]|nr:heavy metal transport/detoxification protein [Clostridiales bacterium]
MDIKKERLQVFDMTCTSCEAKVSRSIRKLEGVINVSASFSGQYVDVEYDSDRCSTSKIKGAIISAGYSTKSSGEFKIVGIIMIALAIIFLGKITQGFDMNEKLNNASYFVLFVVGVLTSIHCVGMCGGIMLSQSVNLSSDTNNSGLLNKLEAIRPAFLYNVGRVISYTLLGGIVGALGSVLSLTTQMQAALQIFAGIFMIIMGLNMSGFKFFRKFHIKLPWSTCSIKRKSNAPFIVGLLNGFMPCGPLQTMQIYALGTGSAFKGSMSMFIFALGTVPLMLTFGVLSGLLSKGYTKKLLKFGGIFIVVLGLIMGQRGLSLAGINIAPITSAAAGSKNTTPSQNSITMPKIENGFQILNMTADGRGYSPNVLYVQKGIPVKWVIDGKQITSCNNEIVATSKKIKQKLKSGENTIEFTPEETGNINFSCWMGMIRGVIRVVDNAEAINTSKVDEDIPPVGAGDSCCSTETSSIPSTPSIFGDDLSKVPTDRIVKKALLVVNNQSYDFKGIGYEFDPLILVINKDINTKLSFDLKQFDNNAGKFIVIDGKTGEEVTSFTGSNGVVNLEYNFKKAGGYGILKDGKIIAVIEAVEDIKKADLGSIRSNYLN